MTGLSTPAAIGFESLFAIFFLRRAAPFLDSVIVLLTGAATYMWWYRVHYWVMINWTIQTGACGANRMEMWARGHRRDVSEMAVTAH